MAQEPFPWDRFKERRYDRPPPDSVGPGSRWREPSPHHAFRGRMPGKGRPVPWRYHSAESDRGFSPSRINDKFMGDEGFRPSGYRMESRYNRFNRENSDPFVHKDMRGHAWENGMSPNNLGRPHFGIDRRSVDDRSSFRQKDIKGHFLENGRMQNGSSQRSLDDKGGSFGRRNLRGKSREKELFEKKDPCSVDDKEPFEKKSLKRRSPENATLPCSSGRPHSLNDQRSIYEKRSYGEKVLRGKNCENGVFPNKSSRIDTVHDCSSMDDKDIKEQSLENNVVPNVPGRLRSVVDKSPDDDQHDKSSSADAVTVSKLEKEHSLGSIDWKPLKWTRSGSLSSRASEQKTEVPSRIDTPLRSPTGDAAACATMSAVSSEETGSRKKTRLGWGEGLAKFEKKKVEGPIDDSATKPGLVGCVSGEPSNVCHLAGRSSPRVAGVLECASPATPSSVAFSPSPGIEDKACHRSAVNLDCESSYSCGSPYLQRQGSADGNREKELCLENVELTSIANLSPSLTELVRLEKAALLDSSFVRSSAMEKLLVWRCETVKALEVAESEIDLLENDLKRLDSKPAKPCEDVPSSNVSGPALPVVIYSPGVEKTYQPMVLNAAPSSSLNNAKSCEDMDVVIIENLEESTVNDSDGDGQLIVALSDEIGEPLFEGLLKSNKESGLESFEVFDKLFPSNHCGVHGSRMSEVTSWKDDLQIKKKFAFKKCCEKFEVRVNTLKYRALQHLWKKDLQSMTSKKDRLKSKKRLEINVRGLHGSNQKHRSSRSRLSNPGKLSLAPTPEAIKFTRKLLSDPKPKPFRDSLKMPAIMDAKERITSRFVSNNGMVEDPYAMEKQRAMINPWTKEEKGIFINKLATFGKDFNKISSFLDNKTTADCVEFYYKNHKSDEFVQLKKKKKPDLCLQRKSYSFNNYLVGSGKRFSRETNAASLDVLGEASAMAAIADNAMKTRQEASCSKALQIDRPVERSCGLDVSVNERETEAANVLAGICGSVPSSSAKTSCLTSSGERKKLTNRRVASDDDDSCSDDSCGDTNIWTDEEKSSFIQGVSIYGKKFEMLSRHVGTRSRDQCMVFYMKSQKCFGLDSICPRLCDEGKDDSNGGGSDNGGACIVEAAALVSSEKMVVDASPVAIEPEVVVEGEMEMEMEIGVDHRGGGGAISSEGSPSADAVNGHGSSGSCGEDGTVDPVKPRSELAAENSSNSKDDVNSSSDKQEPTTGTNLTDLNCVDQELSVGADVSDVAADVSDHIKRIETIDLELNPPLEEPNVISLEEDSLSEKEDSPPEIIPSSFLVEAEAITQKSNEMSLVIAGYPVQMAGKSEMKGFPQRCSGSDKPISAVESSPIHPHSRHHSWSSSSESEQPKRSGDVKLFGQILKSQQQENLNSSTPNLEIVATGRNDYPSLENVPGRSFGLWNENAAAQMGYPSVPDSAILLAKYPAAFGNFSSSSNMEQQQYQLYRNQVELITEMQRRNGVGAEMAGGEGAVDYHQLHMNQQHFISEMQRRNGIAPFSGLRNPMGVVGANVGISDPVDAIKLHYANVDKERQG